MTGWIRGTSKPDGDPTTRLEKFVMCEMAAVFVAMILTLTHEAWGWPF